MVVGLESRFARCVVAKSTVYDRIHYTLSRKRGPERCAVGGDPMGKKITIATASSAEYFHFVQGMILSVRDKPQSKDIDISLYDLGLTAEQLDWMKDYVNNIEKPQWEFGLSDKDGLREPFKAVLAKPLLPKYFPGYDIYMHLDADAWVQDWSAVETYVGGAQKAALVITPEIHRAYSANYGSSLAFRDFIVELYAGTWGEDYVKKYSYYPILNAGVLAMPKESPVWGLLGRECSRITRQEPSPLH